MRNREVNLLWPYDCRCICMVVISAVYTSTLPRNVYQWSLGGNWKHWMHTQQNASSRIVNNHHNTVRQLIYTIYTIIHVVT